MKDTQIKRLAKLEANAAQKHRAIESAPPDFEAYFEAADLGLVFAEDAKVVREALSKFALTGDLGTLSDDELAALERSLIWLRTRADELETAT